MLKSLIFSNYSEKFVYICNIDFMPVVYITTNLINNKKYIGVDGKNVHTYLGSGKILRKAITKYGKENFAKEIIATFENIQDAFLLEIELIERYDAVNSEDYYNIKSGGKGGHNGHDFSGENNPMYGKSIKGMLIEKFGEEEGVKRYKEIYKNVGIAAKKLRGKKMSDEAKEKLSRSKKDYYANITPEERLTQIEKRKEGFRKANIKRSQEYKDNMRRILIDKSESIHRKWRCRYCQMECNIGNLTRWHNENCKHRTSI